MRGLVTLQQAKEHLRVDHDFDDKDIELKISGASSAIISYLKAGAKSFLNETKDTVIEDKVPDEIKIATLLLIGMLYKDRDGENMEKWLHGHLPFQVTALIYHLRVPTMA